MKSRPSSNKAPTIYRAESSGALIRVHPHPPSREIVVAWAAFLLFCPPKSLPRAGLSSFPVPIFLKCAGLSSLLLDCLLFFCIWPDKYISVCVNAARRGVCLHET